MVNQHSSTASAGVSTTMPRKQQKPLTISERNKLAYEAAKHLYLNDVINNGCRETFDQLVKLCGRKTYSEITEPELATLRKVDRRTIQIHFGKLKAVGLLRIEETGNKRRKHLTPFDLNDPKSDLRIENDPDILLALAAQEPDIERAKTLAYQAAMLKAGLFFSADLNDPKCANSAQFGSPLNDLKDLNGDLQGATPPTPTAGGDIFRPKPAAFFGREEPKVRNAETMQLLKEIGCYPSTVRKHGHLAPATVRREIDAARRCGRAAELPAFVAHALDTDGVYEASRWSRRTRRSRAAPQQEASSWSGEPDPDPREPEHQAIRLPTICPTCSRLCQPEWEGHCPRCEPDLFDPVGGGT